MDCGIWPVILLKLKSLHHETEIIGNCLKKEILLEKIAPNGNLRKKRNRNRYLYSGK
jgi:hypothetical protein